MHMCEDWTRRKLVNAALSLGATTLATAPRVARAAARPQRAIIVMCDGLGLDYYAQNPMPTLNAWATGALYARVKAVMPTVTNCNNASICCGAWPSAHGIIGNSYFDPAAGTEEYMEDANLVLAPTIFERARMHGVRSALLSSKKKTIGLLNRGAYILLTAEARILTGRSVWARPRPFTHVRSITGFLRRRETSCATGPRSASSMFTRPTTRCTCGRRRRRSLRSISRG